MRSCSLSVSTTWHHALTIQEEEEARMVLTFEWVSACPLLVLFSTQRSEWLQASHISNKFFPPCFVLFSWHELFFFFFCKARIPPHLHRLSSVKSQQIDFGCDAAYALNKPNGFRLCVSLCVLKINLLIYSTHS